jgi:hypothetical protein
MTVEGKNADCGRISSWSRTASPCCDGLRHHRSPHPPEGKKGESVMWKKESTDCSVE